MKPLLRRHNAEQRNAGIGSYIRQRTLNNAPLNKSSIMNILTRYDPVVNNRGRIIRRRLATRRRLQKKPTEYFNKLVNSGRRLNNTRKGNPFNNLTRNELVKRINKKINVARLTNQNLKNVVAAKHFKRKNVRKLNTRINSIRLQQSGTCWFNAILNGWLLSPIGRKILASRVKYTAQPNAALDNMCPRKKKIPDFFWSYIRFELHAPKDHIWANMKLQNKYHEKNLIQSISLRSTNSVNGGSQDDLYRFLDFIVPGNWTGDRTWRYRYDVTIKTYYYPYDMVDTLTGFKLSHAYIGLNAAKNGHAITGYVTPNGEYRIVDSNSIRPIKCNWFKDARELRDYYYNRYHEDIVSISRTVVFIKEKHSDKLFLPWQKLISP